MELEILYEDDQLIAIHKPNGLLVHRTKLANDVTEFALQLLRDQVDYKVYPTHRLDRKTSGILLFAKNAEMNGLIQSMFMEQQIVKSYRAILRGWTPDEGTIDYDLTNDSGKTQKAITSFKTISQTEIPFAYGDHQTSRYSLVQITPETGRMHQIRKHFAHIRYPIIGDRPHGCNKQNKLFKEHFSMTTMMLHASVLEFSHPNDNKLVTINAPIQSEFKRMISELGLGY